MADTDPRSGYAPVNGLQMYYEIHGPATTEQPPLLLLHGGFLSIATSFSQIFFFFFFVAWGAVWSHPEVVRLRKLYDRRFCTTVLSLAASRMLPTLAARRQVVAVEQQGHGHTADIDRPLTFEQEADDTAAALRHLGIEQVDVFGYSDGGNVALGLAIRHPALVRKLAIAGTNVTNEGLVPGIYDFMEGMTPEMLGDELRTMYEAEAPRPEDWPVLVEKVKQQVIALEGWTPAQLQSIASPTLVIIADADVVTPEHALEMVRPDPAGPPGRAPDARPHPAGDAAGVAARDARGVLRRADARGWMTDDGDRGRAILPIATGKSWSAGNMTP